MLTRLHLAWRLYRDPRVAPRMKIALPLLALLYVISPIDLIPDVLLGAGQIDDLTVLALLVVFFGRLAKWAPSAVVEEHLARARGLNRTPSASPRRAAREGDVIDADYRVVD